MQVEIQRDADRLDPQAADTGMAVKDVYRQAGISMATHYPWKWRFGGMEALELKYVRDLEEENSRLKRMYADLALENSAMKDLIEKSCCAGVEVRGDQKCIQACPDTPRPAGSRRVNGRGIL